jgi:hypothetical protein
MKSADCSRKAREYIDNDVRRRLAQRSNFACSICGSIPIVFHHIEHWSKNFSNDERILIPICDKCHRGIHGEGGTLFSNDELYQYKSNPKSPPFLSDKLPLEGKKSYSFFVGSNFVANGERASLFAFSNGQNLLTIDTSSGSLMLTILVEINDGRAVYLIQKNEIMVNANDIWDMHYSRSTLKLWRIIDNKKTVFIDLVIKPDLIILREMKTVFDGKPFLIYKFRKPQQRQVNKIREVVRQYEELYQKLASQIDGRPKVSDISINGIDFDAFMRETDKNLLKTRMEQELTYEFCHEFAWDWQYYQWVLKQVLAESPIFARATNIQTDLPEVFKPTYEMIAAMKAKYKEEFEGLEDTIVKYAGLILQGCVLA